MSSPDTSNNPADSEALDAGDQIDDSDLASKLSKELSNWRRKRGGGGGPGARFRDDRAISKVPMSEPARTIKVRGHETLVIRKGKLAAKSRPDSAPPRD
ncbi:MAG TPA: hypothetical protein VGY99_05910 [Candidatus Binataceae bacterium]|jgi:hypothetical protein|nr:hypothetical protein [Candidatus Binataceae bacterium]